VRCWTGDDCLRGRYHQKQERCCHRDAGRTHFFLHVDVGACGDSARGSNPCVLPGRDLLRLDWTHARLRASLILARADSLLL
jgi:hypothetical protein